MYHNVFYLSYIQKKSKLIFHLLFPNTFFIHDTYSRDTLACQEAGIQK